jgi:hypothetical protein
MLRDCWPSVRSSSQNATGGSILRRCALVYLPTICVVSVFVALTWLGLSMNNGTFRDKDLVVVITYFAALLVLECVFLTHVAIRRQRTVRPSPKPPCVEDSAQTAPSFTNGNVGHHAQPANPSAVNLAHVQSQLGPEIPRPSVVGNMMAERPHEATTSDLEITKPPTSSSPNPSLPQSHKFPTALCQPYHPSTTPEVNRPPTAVAYIPPHPPGLPVPPQPMPDIRSSWDLTMANDHQSLAVQPLTTAPPVATLFQPEARPKPPFEPPSAASGNPSTRPDHQATETHPLQSDNHISAYPTSTPARHKSRETYSRSTGGRACQQPQSHSQSPGAQRVQPQPHSHSSLLQRNLIALAGT